MKKVKDFFAIRKYWAGFFLLVILIGTVLATVNHTRWVSIQKYNSFGSTSRIYLKHVTTSVLDFATASSDGTIGDVWVTGRPVTKSFAIVAPGDQWLPTGMDTANAINALNFFDGDMIIKRIMFHSTFGAGDTAIVALYKVNTAGTVTAIALTEGANSGADTLVSANDSTFYLTPTSTTTLDQSAGDALAFYMEELGTMTDVYVDFELETYDVQ